MDDPVLTVHMYVHAGIDASKVQADARERSGKGEVIVVHYHSSRRPCSRYANFFGLREKLWALLGDVKDIAGPGDNLEMMQADAIVSFLELRETTGAELLHEMYAGGEVTRSLC
jgi:hypothetical protein